MKDTRHLPTKKTRPRRAAEATILLAFAAAITSGCGQKPPVKQNDQLATALALSAYAPKDRHLVLWSHDGAGRPASHWVVGNDDSLRVVASRAQLLIPWNDRLWLYEVSEVPVELCDCAVEPSGGTSVESDEGLCESLSTVFVSTGRLRDLITDEVVPIDAPITDASQPPTELRFTSSPTSSIGRYLIVDHRTETRYCQKKPSVKFQGFVVIDLETGKRTELFLEEELEELEKNEGEAALALVREGHVALASDTLTLELTAVAPRVTSNGLLNLAYEFSAQTTPVDQGENWQVFTHSVWVPAQKIPEKLNEFVIIPPLVSIFVTMFPQVDVRGFFEVSSDPELSALLLSRFAGVEP